MPGSRRAGQAARIGGLLLPLLAWFASGPPAAAADATGFDVNIVLSGRARALLARLGEGMVLAVSYFGDAKPAAERYVDGGGQIPLADNQEVRLPATSGRYHVRGLRLDRQALRWVSGPVRINVSVASARLASPDNLLECDFMDEPLARARRGVTSLHCRLIRGDDPAALPTGLDGPAGPDPAPPRGAAVNP